MHPFPFFFKFATATIQILWQVVGFKQDYSLPRVITRYVWLGLLTHVPCNLTLFGIGQKDMLCLKHIHFIVLGRISY